MRKMIYHKATVARCFYVVLWCVGLLWVSSVTAKSLSEILPVDVDGYATAPPGLAAGSAWPYDFPQDHLSHEAYRSELWQIYLRLQNAQGVTYGLTGRILRIGVVPPTLSSPQEDASSWQFSGAYLSVHGLAKQGSPAQVASTQPLSSQSFAFSRTLSRDALSLAGFRDQPALLWNHHQRWRWQSLDKCNMHLELDIVVEKVPVLLMLTASHCPIVNSAADLQSLWGFAQSIDDVSGTLGADQIVSGSGWLERAWGELPVGEGPVVIDQFKLVGRVNTGSDTTPMTLYVSRTRRRDGSGQPQLSANAYIDGETIDLPVTASSLLDIDDWKSPTTGASYSSGWEMTLPNPARADLKPLQLRLEPHPRNQELDVYGETRWSGLVDVVGVGDTSFTGFAFVDIEPTEALAVKGSAE